MELRSRSSDRSSRHDDVTALPGDKEISMQASTRVMLAATTLILGAGGLSACSSSGSGSAGSKTITVAYQEFGAFTQLNTQMQSVKAQYEKAHPGYTVKLEPIQASENDYYTK